MPHLLHIQEVEGSNLGSQTDHPEVYSFHRFFQASAWMVPYIMPGHFLLQYFNYLFINPFSALN
jgi:hypothetical protein